jgi:hypothetical protein
MCQPYGRSKAAEMIFVLELILTKILWSKVGAFLHGPYEQRGVNVFYMKLREQVATEVFDYLSHYTTTTKTLIGYYSSLTVLQVLMRHSADFHQLTNHV